MKESPCLALRKIAVSSILTAAIVLNTALDKRVRAHKMSHHASLNNGF